MCWTFLLCYRDRYPQCNCAAVAIITPVIHYCMGGLSCGELCSWAQILRPSAVCTLRGSSWTWLFLPVVGQRLALMVQTVLEGIEFVGKFVGLAGLLLSSARQGRCGRMWSPCGIGSCRFLRCRLCRRQLSTTFPLIEKLVELR